MQSSSSDVWVVNSLAVGIIGVADEGFEPI
jgi:hypothetical protein